MPKRKDLKPLAVDLPIARARERFAQTDDPKEVDEAALEEELGLPLRVVEEAATGHRFLVYTSKAGMEFDIRYDGREPWFTQLQLAQMYGVTVPTVNSHIKRFLADGEIGEAVIREF